MRTTRESLVAAIDSVQDHRQTAAEVRPNDLYVRAFFERAGKSQLGRRHGGFTRIAYGKKGSRIVLRRVAGTGWVHEHHELAAAHLAPKILQLRRMQLKIANVGRDADARGAHAESVIQLLHHVAILHARQHGDKAKTSRMLSANGGKPIVDKARCRGVAGAGPADIQRADRKYRHTYSSFIP